MRTLSIYVPLLCAFLCSNVAAQFVQQGSRLVGVGAVGGARQGCSVSISADGNTASVGGWADGNTGAAWVFTRNGSVWSQLGNRLVSPGTGGFGASVSLSSDGNTALVGEPWNGGDVGATWVFARPGTPVAEQAEEVPYQYNLQQNYPNPFNPSTTIEYIIGGVGLQASGSWDVQLSVYDVLGREVAVLVNERKNAGSYEVKFETAGLSSGVYIYRLQAGDLSTGSGQVFAQTKRLLLLR